MDQIKSDLLAFIWSGKDLASFEKWMYEQNALAFEKLIGEDSYLELFSYDFEKKTVKQVKQWMKTILPSSLVLEFEKEFTSKRSHLILGKCIKKEALNFSGEMISNWGVDIGEEYEFITIRLGSKNNNQRAWVKYVDRTNYFQPSYFVPMELFEIDLDSISDLYQSVVNTNDELTIEFKAFADEHYQATEYSFWEDFYNDEKKAIDTYFDTIEQFGIKEVW